MVYLSKDAWARLVCDQVGHRWNLPENRQPLRDGLRPHYPILRCERCGKAMESVDDLAPPEKRDAVG